MLFQCPVSSREGNKMRTHQCYLCKKIIFLVVHVDSDSTALEKWTLRKLKEDFFWRKCRRIVLFTRLNISKNKLYDKGGSIPLSKATIEERVLWLSRILKMRDDKLPKRFGLLALSHGAKR
jgi:hypothetical protein